MHAIITGVGHYVPEKILSNSDLERWSTRMMNGSPPAPASRSAVY